MQQHQELINTLIDLRTQLDNLIVRGLATSSAQDLRFLEQAQQLFHEHGVTNLACAIEDLLTAIDSNEHGAVRLFKLQTALFLFERLFTQSTCLASEHDKGEM
ncbi:hypothetical protein [Motilimonas pumila]|uniref:Uncharacterized protein n=1 Tax=Motilimonas pumila TaxID=2303987 RepID=A0A418Y9Q6_9GAMM|nr:hypothetical protein [Motilimonas pumila]RJG37990.1 hypothetical protein D1Z90_19380 [Motilimonas pumila]